MINWYKTLTVFGFIFLIISCGSDKVKKHVYRLLM